MKKIAVVTATRAEYGLLIPLIRRINEDKDLELELIVTGMHLSEQYGYTADAIQKDGFLITHKITILEEENTPYGVSLTMANAIKGFADCFREDRPDIVVILGDRTEMLGVAAAALNERIPIAHIHGGEVTEGAVDDSIRHALSKMSYLHFTSTEAYRRRVIQLGENPDRVFNVGALGAENILKQTLLGKEEVLKSIADIYKHRHMEYAVVTFHPVTLDSVSAEKQINELCKAMDERPDMFFLITGANADAGGNTVNALLKEYCDKHANAMFTYNLGMIRYLSAVKYAAFVLGNSSSGILEAPVLGTPTVNIGDRQRGRIMTKTIVNCEPERKSILKAMNFVGRMKHIPTNIYGDGTASKQIVQIMKEYLLCRKIDLKKGFYDVEGELE